MDNNEIREYIKTVLKAEKKILPFTYGEGGKRGYLVPYIKRNGEYFGKYEDGVNVIAFVLSGVRGRNPFMASKETQDSWDEGLFSEMKFLKEKTGLYTWCFYESERFAEIFPNFKFDFEISEDIMKTLREELRKMIELEAENKEANKPKFYTL